MKNYLLSLLLLICGSAIAQNCLPQGVSLNTQSQIDSFAILYPGCTHILGNVKIQESAVGGILNLEGLAQISAVDGYLRINFNTNLASLHGLEQLRGIGNDLRINFNASLSNLQGLANLKAICGSLVVTNNDSLSDLNGLSKLKTIGGDFELDNCGALINLSGIDSLQNIGGTLGLAYNQKLNNLSALAQLDSIGDDLRIEHLPALPNLHGLDQLRWVGADVELSFNNALANIDALQQVTHVGNSLLVFFNNALTSLEGLAHIDPTPITEMIIQNNAQLSVCSVASICQYLQNGGLAAVSSNTSGCDDTLEIIAGCQVSGLSMLDKTGRVTLFPNPVQHTLKLDCTAIENAQYQVFNANGLIMMSGPLPPNGLLDVSQLLPGVYVVQLMTADTALLKQFVKSAH